MAEAYLILTCFCLVWFCYKQHLQGRMYPFVILSCLYGIWMVANGQILIDSVTITIFSIVLWMLASILWSESPHTILELFVWCSYFVLFTAARKVSPEFVMWLLLPNGAFLAIHQLYVQITNPKADSYHRFAIFGNGNHNASFMMTSMMASVWLGFNVTPYMFILSGIMAFAIARTKCRGATLGVVFSALYLLSSIEFEFIYYAMFVIFVFGLLNFNRFFKGNYTDRLNIYKDAVKRIHPRWAIGRGLNCLRNTEYGRVHNDFLELIAEIGIIGLSLIFFLFYQITYTNIALACLIGFGVHSLFFYPIREIHTALPFWAIMGSVATPVNNVLAMPVLRITAVLAITFVIIFVLTVFNNLARHKG